MTEKHREPSPTDLSLSLKADEYLWSSEEDVGSHEYLAPTILKRLRDGNHKKVLDIGCGNGSLTRAIGAHGFELVGIDASTSGIEQAKRVGGDFRCCSVDAPLPKDLKGKFDAIIAIEVIEHLLLPRNLFLRAREALYPGGTIIISTPFHGYLKNISIALANGFDKHWHPLRDYGHVKFFSIKTLTNLCTEMGVSVRSVDRVGRLPSIAKSMIFTGKFSGPELE